MLCCVAPTDLAYLQTDRPTVQTLKPRNRETEMRDPASIYLSICPSVRCWMDGWMDAGDVGIELLACLLAGGQWQWQCRRPLPFPGGSLDQTKHSLVMGWDVM